MTGSGAQQAGARPETTLAITRGVIRMFSEHGLSPLAELSLATGRRVDVAALSKTGEITVVEVKSSVEDYRVDQKWESYLDYCDRFFFAVAPEFPLEMLPEEPGLIVADPYGAAVRREAPLSKLSAARRKAMLIRFGQAAANRIVTLSDPGFRLG